MIPPSDALFQEVCRKFGRQSLIAQPKLEISGVPLNIHPSTAQPNRGRVAPEPGTDEAASICPHR